MNLPEHKFIGKVQVTPILTVSVSIVGNDLVLFFKATVMGSTKRWQRVLKMTPA